MNGSESPSCSPTMGRMGKEMPPATPASRVPGVSARAKASGLGLRPWDAGLSMGGEVVKRRSGSGSAGESVTDPATGKARGASARDQ